MNATSQLSSDNACGLVELFTSPSKAAAAALHSRMQSCAMVSNFAKAALFLPAFSSNSPFVAKILVVDSLAVASATSNLDFASRSLRNSPSAISQHFWTSSMCISYASRFPRSCTTPRTTASSSACSRWPSAASSLARVSRCLNFCVSCTTVACRSASSASRTPRCLCNRACSASSATSSWAALVPSGFGFFGSLPASRTRASSSRKAASSAVSAAALVLSTDSSSAPNWLPTRLARGDASAW
mmetsp:Transcript_26809/g.61817  ORF Transcript_26809/g.61817 Transcript_26809/m.61817 type:complete len:243 (-) Transcript_26809:565-1293(-)